MQNVLIDLGASINVMTKEVMAKLHIAILRETPTILQLANSSTIVPNGMLEDVTVTLHSWNYPVDFVVLSPKTSTGGYPIILGHPCLATVDAYIACRLGKMTILDGMNTKKLTLYSPTQPLLQDDQVVWPNLGDSDMDVNSITELMMISRDSFVSIKDEDDVISSIILNEYGRQPEICSQEDCVLENILPLPCELHYFESTQLLHSLLPHKIYSSPIS